VVRQLSIQRLSTTSITLAVAELTQRDRDLASIVKKWGHPPNWERETGFVGLVRTIIGQQLSVASAKAIFTRLSQLVLLTPANFLQLDDAQLQAAGLSQRKILYCRELARAIATNVIDLDKLALMDDANVRCQLRQIKGIGDWTVDIYLLMCLQRPDAFPSGDLALAIAYQKLKRLPKRPTPVELEAITEKWKPWRAVAARILWHYYLMQNKA
jgi:DNA-3-methyladenine glycosylase II